MSRYRNKLALTALLSIGVILLLFWTNWWYVNRLAWLSKENVLGDRLILLGRSLVDEIQNDESSLFLEFAAPDGPVFPPDILEWLPTTMHYDRLTSQASLFFAQHDLEELMILDGEGSVLFDARGNYRIGEMFTGPYPDYDLIAAALNGLTVVSPDREYHSILYKRAYLPLRDSRNRSVAVLRLEKERAYFGEVRMVRNGLLVLGLVCSALLLLVGWVQYRTLKRLARMEETVAREDRLKSLGTLAAGLAHEMRNPLGIMRATAEEIQTETAQHEEVRSMTADLIGEIDRLNRLIAQVLEFSRPSEALPAGPAACCVNDVVENVISFMDKEMASKAIRCEFRQNNRRHFVSFPPNSLRQVLINLLLNAADAVETNGRIEIELGGERSGLLELEVRDNGRGISAEDLAHVFDPFFSTKEMGAGLGLSITKQIVESHGGAVDLTSREGEATTVRLVLKKARAPDDAQSQNESGENSK